MCSMKLWLYKSTSLPVTSASGSLEESTWDNSRHPEMAFNGSSHCKSLTDQDQVSRGNMFFFLLCGKVVSLVIRYDSDFVLI